MEAGNRAKLVLLHPHDEILQVVSRLARQISQDYREKDLVLVAILKGAVFFLVDLARRLEVPCEVDFVSVSTYGAGTSPSRKARLRLGTHLPLKGRDVLVVEDLVDTGHTTTAVLRYLRRQGPRSLRLCALFDKPSRRQVPVTIDYRGLTLPDRFVVGYGTDLNEKYRHLPGLYCVEGA